MSDLHISRHARDRYVQRVDSTSLNPNRAIAEAVQNGRKASEDELLIIRYSRKHLARSLNDRSNFRHDDLVIIHNNVAYVVVDNTVITCFECDYLQSSKRSLEVNFMAHTIPEIPNTSDSLVNCIGIDGILDIYNWWKDGNHIFLQDYEQELQFVHDRLIERRRLGSNSKWKPLAGCRAYDIKLVVKDNS